VIGQCPGDFGDQSRLARPGFTADEDDLAVAVFDTLPGLFEHREFGRTPHERSAAAGDQFGRKRRRHPLRHSHNVTAPMLAVDSQI